MKKAIIILLCLFSVIIVKAQEEIERTNILFVLDASFSMRKNWETKSKWTIAKETLVGVADSLKNRLGDNVYFGIRAYGHQSMPVDNDCEDSELIIPIANNSVKHLKNTLEGISPKGITPLAYSLEKTKTDFANLEGKNILILITDGAESCQGDPCNIMKVLMDNQVVLKPFIIGLNIPLDAINAYQCMGGVVYNESSQVDFKLNLQKSIDRAITYTTLQVNLLDGNFFASQTDKTMFFYDKKTNKLQYTFYHKFNKNGASDTLYIKPDSYKVEVQTIPKVVSKYFTLDAAKHNVLDIQAATGILKISFLDIENEEVVLAKPLKYLIKNANETQYLHQEFTGIEQEYLIGKYDIDLFTLPAIQLNDVLLKNNQLNELRIPAPGILSLKSNKKIHGAIFVKNVDSLINIYSLQPNTTQEILDLQPGEYTLVYRYSNERKMMKTKAINFKIKALKTTKLNL